MKKVLIVGENSYIGTSFYNMFKDKYEIVTISSKNNNWKNKSFFGYDCLINVAGIAHVYCGEKNKDKYYEVNTNLAIELAKKAKNEKVRQYIYMSSMLVYGTSSLKKEIKIDNQSQTNPTNAYGDSKLKAEVALLDMDDEQMKVAIIRPPMVYGKNCKGNYQKLVNYGKKMKLFPKINNKRSMIHIDNLCNFIRLIIDNEDRGVYHPQNNEYVSTSAMVDLIAKAHKRQIIFTKMFNPLISFLSLFSEKINKAFGSFYYDYNLSKYKENYCIYSLVESIEQTEKDYDR